MSSWTPHLFRKQGEQQGFRKSYLDLLEADGRTLLQRGFPVVFSLGHIAAITDTPYNFLAEVVRRRADPYRHFRIRKRSGGKRRIVAPNPLLLNVQRWIDQRILSKAAVLPCSTAFSTGSSPLKNAQPHCGATWMVKTDIRNFFESISERQVYHVFREFGYRKVVAFELARLTTRPFSHSTRYKQAKRWTNSGGWQFFWSPRVGHLPQGAPSSPKLANLVCRKLDQILSDLAAKNNCFYTRYADDIVFSGTQLDRKKAVQLLRECSKALSTFGFQRNRHKSRILPPGARKVVTGLTVNDERPRLPREMRDRIRSHLYYSRRYGPVEHCKRTGFRSVVGFKAHLGGLIEYCISVDAALGNRFRGDFNQIPWPI
jgi:RNA-directed DNA polymerase